MRHHPSIRSFVHPFIHLSGSRVLCSEALGSVLHCARGRREGLCSPVCKMGAHRPFPCLPTVEAAAPRSQVEIVGIERRYKKLLTLVREGVAQTKLLLPILFMDVAVHNSGKEWYPCRCAALLVLPLISLAFQRRLLLLLYFPPSPLLRCHPHLKSHPPLSSSSSSPSSSMPLSASALSFSFSALSLASAASLSNLGFSITSRTEARSSATSL